MYVPSHFREDDTDKLHQCIRNHSFGLLVISDDEGIEANHLPFLLLTEGNGSTAFMPWPNLSARGSNGSTFAGTDHQ